MTRRQASMVDPSPKSLAASITIQAASMSDGSGFDLSPSKNALISASTLRRWAMFANDKFSFALTIISMRLDFELSVGALAPAAVLARLIELDDGLGRFRIQIFIFRRELPQLAGGDAVILGAQEQKRHRGVPGEA